MLQRRLPAQSYRAHNVDDVQVTIPPKFASREVVLGNPKWQPGISGNPGGRSSELAAQQSAAKLKEAGLADEALDFLVKTLRNKGEATPYRLRAATEILDRALGRPAQAIDIEFILKQRLTELSVDELRLLEERLITVSPPRLLVNGTMKS